MGSRSCSKDLHLEAGLAMGSHDNASSIHLLSLLIDQLGQVVGFSSSHSNMHLARDSGSFEVAGEAFSDHLDCVVNLRSHQRENISKAAMSECACAVAYWSVLFKQKIMGDA